MEMTIKTYKDNDDASPAQRCAQDDDRVTARWQFKDFQLVHHFKTSLRALAEPSYLGYGN